jgi:hypothetical protein
MMAAGRWRLRDALRTDPGDQGIHKSADIFLRKAESEAMIQGDDKIAGSKPRLSQRMPRRKERKSRLRRFAHNLRREPIFLFGFAVTY